MNMTNKFSWNGKRKGINNPNWKGGFNSKKHYQINREIKLKQFKEYYLKNKEIIKTRMKKYRIENVELIKEQTKQRRLKNKDKIKSQQRNSYYKNKELIIQHQTRKILERLKNDIIFRLNWRMSDNIRQQLKQHKNVSAKKILNYTIEDLKYHLESLFQEGMTWDNYGKWHIDHIIPKSWFKFNSVNDPEFKRCWSLNNLQPKWASENCSKGNRYSDLSINMQKFMAYITQED